MKLKHNKQKKMIQEKNGEVHVMKINPVSLRFFLIPHWFLNIIPITFVG